MKKMKRMLSLMLALGLVLVLAVPVFASPVTEEGTITIKNAEDGKNYQAYRMFDLSFDEQGGHYAYTVNAAWDTFFTTGEGKDLVTIDRDYGSVSLRDETAAGMQQLAQKAKVYAEQNRVHAYTPTGTAPVLTFSNLPLGYYLVTSDTGALQALDTTNKNAVMYEKNTAPDVQKSADKTHAAYGEVVHFTIPVTKGGYVWGDYVIKDTMTGLELEEGTVKITVNETELDPGTDYVVVPEGNNLTVTIPEKTLNKRNGDNTDFVYPAGTKFVLTYDAVAKATGSMENKVFMEYKTNPSVSTPDGKTPEHSVKVANYEFGVKKTNGQGTVLNEATFALHKNEDCSDGAMEFIKTGNTYRLAQANETAAEGSTKTSTISAGEVTIEGLAAGTYYLQELQAPNGYNKLLKPVKVEIIENLNDKEGTKYYQQAFDEAGNRINPTIKMNGETVSSTEGTGFVLDIVNKTGTELPSTGGIGTTIFYVVGGLLMAGAAVALIAKKRIEK